MAKRTHDFSAKTEPQVSGINGGHADTSDTSSKLSLHHSPGILELEH